MAEKKRDSFRLQLTDEQKKMIHEATGKDASAIEMSVEELEERIAPFQGLGMP